MRSIGPVYVGTTPSPVRLIGMLQSFEVVSLLFPLYTYLLGGSVSPSKIGTGEVVTYGNTYDVVSTNSSGTSLSSYHNFRGISYVHFVCEPILHDLPIWYKAGE